MRILLALAAILLAAAVSKPAMAQDYPWCVHYGHEGTRNCGFTSWQQCMWTAFGADGLCTQNPFYYADHPADAPRLPKKRKKLVRR